MKLVILILLAGFTVSVHSGFSYSSGWKPGQTVTSQTAIRTASIEDTAPSKSQFSWFSLLTSGPLGGFFARSGINITEKLEDAQRKVAELPWDDRIPLITDENFEGLITQEPFATKEEEESRVWFLVVTVTSSQRTGISALVDEQFNEAFNITLIEQDLPDVRWGRIDYFNVTRLTTKWAVWRAPMLIVAKNSGKTLRFFYPQQIGVRAPQLRDFLLQKLWARRKPWTGPWAPGGHREELLDRFAIFQEALYFYMTKVPRWVYLVVSGGLGSVLIQLFHRKSKPASGEKTRSIQNIGLTPVAGQQKDSVVESNVESKKTSSQRRKGGKK